MQKARQGDAASFSHGRFAHPKRNVSALNIQHAMKIADFGAGSGAYVLAMAHELEGSGKVYAIDIQKDLLRRIHNEAAQKGLKNVDVVWGDVEASQGSKIADGTLDLVLISNLLFQVDGKEDVANEAKRILKPGGRLAVIDWSESFGGMGPRRDDVVTKEETLALVRACGLAFQKEFPAGAHHYGLMFRKEGGKSVKIRKV